jgi:hypothetical protein
MDRKNLLSAAFLITASLFNATNVSATAADASQPVQQAAPVTNAPGEAYLDSILKAIAGLTHREILSVFTASMGVPVVPDGAKHATVCVQKVANGMFRSHSNNPQGRGIVTNAGDLAAFGPIFELRHRNKFILNVSKNVDGSGGIVSYLGQVIAKDGDGSAMGDTVCFARYLQNDPAVVAAPAAAPTAPAAAPAAPAATPAPAAPASAPAA